MPANAALRERMFLAYNTRAYPANKPILLDLLATRQEFATILGFRSWADLATADQMMKFGRQRARPSSTS